ncbi:MAG: helix-turn-helix domain-containing protein [Actinomyces sp.]|jgi:transcriptional regulator with XRE-family HTH domain|nr:helix-turn-helix domain-containing protein [Actinomyces sp.]MCI1788999.1 helix-turn-helix domain-containing protein [Actinomyces sp.]MCI1830424.1 helix-turn-helix domain-containing protein [Actinomyces sp.]
MLATTTTDVGTIIAGERRAQGLTQHDLAQRMGVSRGSVIALESPNGNPRLTTLLRAVSALGLRLGISK